MAPARLPLEKSGRGSDLISFISINMIDDATFESMEAVVDYLLETERKHWQEAGRPRRHIYRHVKQLAEAAKALRPHYDAHRLGD